MPDIQDGIITDKLHEIKPSSLFEQEAYNRAHQYSHLTWIPKRNIPRQGGVNYFHANEERKGMLYAESASQDKRVGYDVSLYTFLTALNNPFSLLYSENVSINNSTSAYGISYYGDTNSGAYMGVACNTYVYMVLGSIIPYSSYETASFVEHRGIVSRLSDQSSQALYLFDILQTPGHVRMVTRLWTDNQHVIKAIEISEAVGSGVQSICISVDDFDEWLRNSGYSIYRFNKLFSVGDVSPLPSIDSCITSYKSISYNNDICTFAGDCATFQEDDLIYINYVKGNYSFIEIYRDEKLIDTIALDKNPSIHEIDVSNRQYGFGLFKARLVGQDCYSDYTYWEVLKTEVRMEGQRVTFKCYHSYPLYWGWYNQSGWACWKQCLTSQEINNGEIELTHIDNNYTIFKLYVQGKYGRVAVRL